jgi:hypothetical protein
MDVWYSERDQTNRCHSSVELFLFSTQRGLFPLAYPSLFYVETCHHRRASRKYLVLQVAGICLCLIVAVDIQLYDSFTQPSHPNFTFVFMKRPPICRYSSIHNWAAKSNMSAFNPFNDIMLERLQTNCESIECLILSLEEDLNSSMRVAYHFSLAADSLTFVWRPLIASYKYKYPHFHPRSSG